jgi:hypothetical protein
VAFDAASSAYVIAWSVNVAGTTTLALAKATSAGLVGSVKTIASTTTQYQILRIVPTPAGYALLLGIYAPSSTFVVALDSTGAPSSVVHAFANASFGFDLAAQGGELGLLAQRSTQEVEFRPLGDDGAPLGGWVCLDGPSTNAFELASVDGDGTADYAVVYRTPANDETLVRFDHLGTGNP